jgi:hypothetical protein
MANGTSCCQRKILLYFLFLFIKTFEIQLILKAYYDPSENNIGKLEIDFCNKTLINIC